MSIQTVIPDGIAPGGRWRARAERRAEPCPERFQRSDNATILTHYIRTSRHLGRRAWSEADREILEEIHARSWTVAELSTRKERELLHALEPFARRDHYKRSRVNRHVWEFLSMLAVAYRFGALGLLLSYEDVAAELDISRSTWRRLRHWMEAEGLITVIRIAEERKDKSARGTNNGRNLYQLGAKILGQLRFGLLEGSKLCPVKKAARSEAQAARQSARGHRRVRAAQERKAAHTARGKWRDRNPDHKQATRLELPEQAANDVCSKVQHFPKPQEPRSPALANPKRSSDSSAPSDSARQSAEPIRAVPAQHPCSKVQDELTTPGYGGGVPPLPLPRTEGKLKGTRESAPPIAVPNPTGPTNPTNASGSQGPGSGADPRTKSVAQPSPEPAPPAVEGIKGAPAPSSSGKTEPPPEWWAWLRRNGVKFADEVEADRVPKRPELDK